MDSPPCCNHYGKFGNKYAGWYLWGTKQPVHVMVILLDREDGTIDDCDFIRSFPAGWDYRAFYLLILDIDNYPIIVS